MITEAMHGLNNNNNNNNNNHGDGDNDNDNDDDDNTLPTQFTPPHLCFV
jgi:hypothetical protein